MFSKLKLIDLLLHLFHLKYFSHAKSFPKTTNTPVLTETSAKKLIFLKLQNITLQTQFFFVKWELFIFDSIPSLKSISRTPNTFYITINTSFIWNKCQKSISLLATKVNLYNTKCFKLQTIDVLLNPFQWQKSSDAKYISRYGQGQY